jgi:hypothetical protein
MKWCSWVLAMIWAITLCAPLQAQTESNAKRQKSTVSKLDGTKYFGFVEITDDYTIRITNDSGITRLPITQLADVDFLKYGFQKDRAKDGRFWYERREALKDTDEGAQAPNNAEGAGTAPLEIRLSEISAFEPLIAAYEKTLAGKQNSKPASASETGEKPDNSEVPFKALFSEPGLGGPLPQPFSLGSPPIQLPSGLQPPTSGPGEIIQPGTGSPGLPSRP